VKNLWQTDLQVVKAALEHLHAVAAGALPARGLHTHDKLDALLLLLRLRQLIKRGAVDIREALALERGRSGAGAADLPQCTRHAGEQEAHAFC
jgi:hypothetical protein